MRLATREHVKLVYRIDVASLGLELANGKSPSIRGPFFGSHKVYSARTLIDLRANVTTEKAHGVRLSNRYATCSWA